MKYFYSHNHDNNILTSLQSGSIPGDSNVNQLVYFYNAFCQALNTGKEVRVVFSDNRKAFDRVWHEGLLLKLDAAGISGNLLAWFHSYLANRKHRCRVRLGLHMGSRFDIGSSPFLVIYQ